MIYSFLVLTVGVFLGQEYNLPSVKNVLLYTYNFLNERKKVKDDDENNNNIYNLFNYFNR
jgi:hypothetical protein